MELWLALCFIPSLLWAITNVFDQHVTRKFFPDKPIAMQVALGLGALATGVPVLTWCLLTQTFALSFQSIAAYIGLGFFFYISIIPYLKALHIDEARVVVPLFQLVPVFIFLFEWILIGNLIASRQIIAGFIIIAAAIGITYDFRAFQIKWKTLFFMILTCTGIALFATGSKHLPQAEEIHWLPLTASVNIGCALYGISAFCFLPKVRKQFCEALTTHKPSTTLGTVFLGITITGSLAMLLYQKILTISPAASLPQVSIGGLQSLYIFLASAVMALFSPKTMSPIHVDWHLAWQILCIFAIIGGLYLLA